MKSSYSAANGACVQVAPGPNGTVLVWDDKNPIVPPLVWTSMAWTFFLDCVRLGSVSEAIRSYDDGVSLGRPDIDEDYLFFYRDEWRAFVLGVKAGEFDVDKLRSASTSGGLDDAERPVGSVGMDGSDPAATGAGETPSSSPAPVAASSDVPAGRLSDQPCDPTTPPPLGVDRPGPRYFDDSTLKRMTRAEAERRADGDRPMDIRERFEAEVDALSEVIAEARMRGIYAGTGSLARAILAHGWKREDYPVAWRWTLRMLEEWEDEIARLRAELAARDTQTVDADELLRRGAAPLVDHNPDGAS